MSKLYKIVNLDGLVLKGGERIETIEEAQRLRNFVLEKVDRTLQLRIAPIYSLTTSCGLPRMIDI